MSKYTIHLVEMEIVYLRNDGFFWHVCVAPRALCFQDLKNMVATSDMWFILFYFAIVEFILSNMTSVLDMCVVHQTSDNRRSLMAKKWLFSTCIWAFVCMYVPGLRRLWFQDLKSQSKSRKSFLVWTVWVGYLARENQNRKKEKSNTRASENRLYRSRIAGNFDTAKSQGATTARTRADASSLLGHHGHQGGSGGYGKNKTHQPANRKIKRK